LLISSFFSFPTKTLKTPLDKFQGKNVLTSPFFCPLSILPLLELMFRPHDLHLLLPVQRQPRFFLSRAQARSSAFGFFLVNKSESDEFIGRVIVPFWLGAISRTLCRLVQYFDPFGMTQRYDLPVCYSGFYNIVRLGYKRQMPILFTNSSYCIF